MYSYQCNKLATFIYISDCGNVNKWHVIHTLLSTDNLAGQLVYIMLLCKK